MGRPFKQKILPTSLKGKTDFNGEGLYLDFINNRYLRYRGLPILDTTLAYIQPSGNILDRYGTITWEGIMQTASISMSDGDKFGLVALRDEVFGPLYARKSGADAQIAAMDSYGNVTTVTVAGGWDAVTVYKSAVTWDLAAGTFQVAFGGVAGTQSTSFQGW